MSLSIAMLSIRLFYERTVGRMPFRIMTLSILAH
jgi:hypothetical protein